eukprot:m.898035 g.898035  ORF g.898035 m.898035 type:complete len:313 (+) comp23671_c0_seq16:257-1195(+)
MADSCKYLLRLIWCFIVVTAAEERDTSPYQWRRVPRTVNGCHRGNRILRNTCDGVTPTSTWSHASLTVCSQSLDPCLAFSMPCDHASRPTVTWMRFPSSSASDDSTMGVLNASRFGSPIPISSSLTASPMCLFEASLAPVLTSRPTRLVLIADGHDAITTSTLVRIHSVDSTPQTYFPYMLVVPGTNSEHVVSDIQDLVPSYPHIAALVRRNSSVSTAPSVASIPSVNPGEIFQISSAGESIHTAESAGLVDQDEELVVAVDVGSHLHVRVVASQQSTGVPFNVQISSDGQAANVTLPFGVMHNESMMAHLC